MTPLRVFIGFDSREGVAFHVLSHSILSRATAPVSITPLSLSTLRGIFRREQEPLQSTEFAYSRFLVPYLCGFEGHAVFMDCDMLCRTDIWRLMMRPLASRPGDKALWLCPHDYTPRTTMKFLGQVQSSYPRKNWSSLMVYDNAQCQMLTPGYVATATGRELHRFEWLCDEQIEHLPLAWNYLVDEDGQSADPPNVVHFTNGGPYFDEYATCEYADEWFAERDRMLGVSVPSGVAA